MRHEFAEAADATIAINPVDEVLSYHAGDVRAAIQTLLKDCVESGGAKVGHGSGGIVLLRAA